MWEGAHTYVHKTLLTHSFLSLFSLPLDSNSPLIRKLSDWVMVWLNEFLVHDYEQKTAFSNKVPFPRNTSLHKWLQDPWKGMKNWPRNLPHPAALYHGLLSQLHLDGYEVIEDRGLFHSKTFRWALKVEHSNWPGWNVKGWYTESIQLHRKSRK